MQLQIFYFSGTGNSLYIARELHKSFPESNLIPILNEFNSDKIEVNSASYIFAVATRGGSPCNVFRDIDNMLKKKGKQLDSHFFIDMPNNFTHMAETPTQENIIKLNSEALIKLESIKDIVSRQKNHQEKILNKSLLRKKILFPILSAFLHKTEYLHTDRKFYADSNCTGCGLCSKTCLSNKIEINEGKPHWRDDAACIFCFACLNYCPHKVIQIRGSKSVVKGRYHHQEVTPNEISMQKISSELYCKPSQKFSHQNPTI
jgi:ferredoxin